MFHYESPTFHVSETNQITGRLPEVFFSYVYWYTQDATSFDIEIHLQFRKLQDSVASWGVCPFSHTKCSIQVLTELLSFDQSERVVGT